MAASVTSLESGGLGDVNKDDEKQTEKTGGIAHIAETSNKESNLSSGEGDRQNAETAHRHKEADLSSSVDYPQQATSSDKESQITGSKVLIEKSSTKDSDLALNLSSSKGDRQHAKTAHRYKEADQSSSVDYIPATSSAEESQITGSKVLIEKSSSKESDLASGEGDRQNAGTVHRHKEVDQSSSVDYPRATPSAEASQITGSGVLIEKSSTKESDLPSGEVDKQKAETVYIYKEAARSSSVDYPQTSSPEDSQITASEVLIEMSSTKDLDLASVTSPVAEPAVEQTNTDYLQTSSPEDSQITGSEVLIEKSSPKDLDLASVTSPVAEPAVEQTNTDYPQTSSPEDSQITGSEVLIEKSSPKDLDLASVTSPVAEPAVEQTNTDYPQTSSPEDSQITGSEVLIEKSSPKDLDLASVTSPVAEPAVEQINTDQDNISTLTNSSEEVNAEKVVQTSSQDVNVCESKFATEDLQQKSGCSQNISPAKPKLKSEASEEDNVFDDGTRAQASEIASNNDEPPFLMPASSEPASDTQHKKLETEVHEERPVREMLVRRSRTESTDSNTDRPHVEPLTFSVAKHIETINDEETKANDMCECLLCDRSYPANNKEDVLAHMVLMHKFVIADVNFIGILPEYIRYWKKRFEDTPYSEFCSKIVTNAGVKDDASKEEFFLLCDALPEDKALREDLQRKKLESVLAQQQKEREETKFCRQCLFCNQTFCGNRAVLLDHLVRDHTFHVGQPDNLVFTDELFDLIQSKLDSLLCLFCEKAFKDKPSLREHMRKKQHRKINPKHKEYDRFYIVNYMEMGKNWQSLQSEDSRLDKTSEKNVNEEDEWSGWNEESASQFVCLFCDVTAEAVTGLLEHMKETHSFDLHELSTTLQLNFYQKVKIINFIRKQVYLNTCYGCQQTFQDKDELLAHLDESPTHSQNLPDAEAWDQEIYFAPTYEDDRLLCCLEDDDDDDDDDDSGDGAAGDTLVADVITEDIPIPDTILLKDKKLCQDLLKT